MSNEMYVLKEHAEEEYASLKYESHMPDLDRRSLATFISYCLTDC